MVKVSLLFCMHGKRVLPRSAMGLHRHNSIDYDGIAFSSELLEWGCTFKFLKYENLNK